MEKLGYFTTYKILNAMDFGIPQKRKRVFAISKLDGEPFNFDLLKHRPLKPLRNFLEVTTDQKYLVTQPSMLSKIRSKSSLATGQWQIKVVKICLYDYHETRSMSQ